MNERVNELLEYGKLLETMSDEMVLTREKTEVINELRKHLRLQTDDVMVKIYFNDVAKYVPLSEIIENKKVDVNSLLKL